MSLPYWWVKICCPSSKTVCFLIKCLSLFYYFQKCTGKFMVFAYECSQELLVYSVKYVRLNDVSHIARLKWMCTFLVEVTGATCRVPLWCGSLQAIVIFAFCPSSCQLCLKSHYNTRILLIRCIWIMPTKWAFCFFVAKFFNTKIF